MNKQPVSYLQTDPRWAKKDYSAKGEKTTIGASGCGPTAMAIAVATMTDTDTDPAKMAAWAADLPREKDCRVELANSVWVRDDGSFEADQDFLETAAGWVQGGGLRLPI